MSAAATKTVVVLDDAASALCAVLAADGAHRFVPATTASLPLQAADAEVLVAMAPRVSAAVVAQLPRLAWVHALTTGVDNLLAAGLLGPQVALSNSRGMHGPQMSEHALMLMMACARRLPAMLRHQAEARWERWPQPLLQHKTVCIVGLGASAEALAARCRAFEMRVTGVSSHRLEAPGFDLVYPRQALVAAVAEADFVVVLVPYADDTHHLIDAPVLQAMKPAAVLVNLARGGCVDEAALAIHLRERRIAGAACDVFQAEPLPADSPLWALPNLIVTPHVGGWSDVYAEQALPLLQRNLAAYAAGGAAALHNRVR